MLNADILLQEHFNGMSTDVLFGVVSVLLAAIIAAIVSWIITRTELRANDRRAISEMIDRILMVAIEYPYLEDDNFSNGWPEEDKSTEKAMRYENYCCMVFNLLERLWKFCGGEVKCMEGEINARELIRRHHHWWVSDPENSNGYDAQFCDFVMSESRGMEND